MGLDMYLEGHKFLWTNWEDPSKNRQEDGFQVSNIELRLGYWRKHPNLHGYIVKTFTNGEDKCQPIELNAEAILNIMEAVKGKRLLNTDGFFFGASTGDAAEIAEDVEHLEKALAWLETEEKGVSRSVVYRASW